MKPSEIKALRKAETIEQVVAMVDCREFEHAEEQAAHIKTQLLRQYSTRLKHDVPEATAINQVKADVVNANGGTIEQQSEFWRAADAAMIPNMNIRKAEQVQQVYDSALRDNLYSKDCYAAAMEAAEALGGNEIDNSNMTDSHTSKVTFEFGDLSIAQVTYGGVFVIC